MQLAEVADARLQKAMDSVKAKQSMMEKIDCGARFLKLFMTIGSTAAEVSHLFVLFTSCLIPLRRQLDLISQSVATVVTALFKVSTAWPHLSYS